MIPLSTVNDFLSSRALAVDGVVVVAPRSESEGVVREAVSLGIRWVWLRQGAAMKVAIGI